MKLFRRKLFSDSKGSEKSEEKLFAYRDSIFTDVDFCKYSSRFLLEIIKTVEMISKSSEGSKKNSIHWISDKLWNSKMDEFIYIGEKDGLFPLYVFGPALLDKSIRIYKKNSSKIEKYLIDHKMLSGLQLVADMKNRLYKGLKDYDGISLKKYKLSLPKEPILSDKEYLDLFKYIVLCLSGQLNPDLHGFKCSEMQRATIDLDSDSFLGITKKQFNHIISKCILNTLEKLKKIKIDDLPKEHQILKLL